MKSRIRSGPKVADSKVEHSHGGGEIAWCQPCASAYLCPEARSHKLEDRLMFPTPAWLGNVTVVPGSALQRETLWRLGRSIEETIDLRSKIRRVRVYF